MLFDDGFGAGDFAFAGLAVLLHDVGEVVHVVDVDVVEVGGGGFDVAGHAEVHEKQRAIAAGGHGGFEDVALEDGFFGAHRGDDDVGFEQRGVPGAPLDDPTAKLLGESFGAFAGTIHDEKMSDAAVAKGGDDLFADGAGAEDESGALGELAEDALGELYAGGGDGHGAGAEFRFGADALADFERALKQAIEDRAGGALFVGEAIGFADLAEDFGFAEQHGVESAGDAEEMANGGAIVVMIERDAQNIRRARSGTR